MVPWHETRIGLNNRPGAPTLGTFQPLVNEQTFTFGGFSWVAYFASAAAAYAASKDQFNNFRFEVRFGDATDADISAGNLGTERSEINHNGSLDQTRIINISYRQMIEHGAPINGRKLFALGQLHQNYDFGDVRGVAPFLVPCGDYTQVIARASVVKPTTSQSIVASFFGASPARGVWTLYRWRFKHATDGFLQVFRNGSLIVDYTGPFGYNNVNGPSPQFGVYRASSPETIVVYYSGISISYE